MKLYKRLLQCKYNSHKFRAASRGIPFTLTFQEWAELWAPHWNVKDKDGLMMCRILDMDGYSLGNVYIGSAADNAKDRSVVAKWNAYWHNWSVQEKLKSLN